MFHCSDKIRRLEQFSVFCKSVSQILSLLINTTIYNLVRPPVSSTSVHFFWNFAPKLHQSMHLGTLITESIFISSESASAPRYDVGNLVRE